MAPYKILEPLADRLRRGAQRTDLLETDVAHLLGIDPHAMSGWLANPTDALPQEPGRMVEVATLLERLAGVLKPAAARDWLFSANRTLGGERPIDLVANGEADRVLAISEALAEGVFV